MAKQGNDDEEEDTITSKFEQVPPPEFFEVLCESSRKIRRFAAGTTAGFALYTINHKLDFGVPRALYIEAVKEGEEPIIFGPSAILVNYGTDWKMHTVSLLDDAEAVYPQKTSKLSDDMAEPSKSRNISKPVLGAGSASVCWYFVKILIAFLFIFLLGAIFTVLLEALPQLILLTTPQNAQDH